MIQRAIHIFPPKPHNSAISEYRKEHDYLYKVIDPHITIVFPFYSTLEERVVLEEVKNCISGMEKFRITVNGIDLLPGRENCLSLEIRDGRDELCSINKILYKGLFSQFKDPEYLEVVYKPHITIGRFKTKEEMETQARMDVFSKMYFSFIAKKISIEIIGNNNESKIENEIYFIESV